MALHQYIGARYVPYYYENSLDPTSSEWEPNVNYEALTVVTLPNLHSYISKKFVPDTIGSPALNPEYWLDSGSDNAYIQQLQQDVANINTAIGDIAQLNTESTDLVGGINEVNDRTKRKAAIFGNSFAAGVGSVTVGIYDQIKDIYDDTVYYNQSGGSFLQYTNNANYTFTRALNDAPADNEVTDVVVLGAVGEPRSMQEYDLAGWIAAMKTTTDAFVADCKLKYPNVKKLTYIYCGNMPGYHYSSSKTASGYMDFQAEFWTHLLMEECLAGNEMLYGGWAGWDLLLDPSLFQSDHVHPTQEGTDIISKNVRSILTGNGITYNTKIFYNTGVTIHTSENGTGPVTIAHFVTPEETIQGLVQGGGNASVEESINNVIWDVINYSNLSFMPPIGHYGSTGGVLSSSSRDETVTAQAQHDDSKVYERYSVDATTRNTRWRRAGLAGMKIYTARNSRFPTNIRIHHDPHWNGAIL